MATLELHQVGKCYPGGVWAVRGVDLAVADGEFVVLVGPSGCGKSTTLRMVAGLEEVSEGEIRIAGRVVNEVPARERDIAMVFQEYALYPHMTVRRNLLFGLEPRRRYRSRLRRLLSPAWRRAARAEDAELAARVRRAVEVLDIGHLLDRRPRELSGGQRQRVALGRAIVREPVAFLFDEPLSNLDARLRVGMRTEIKALQRRLGVTSLYVTHDQEEAMTLGDRLVVMKDGLVQQLGTPGEVYARPANRFVAGFVGTPPMNLLEGRLEADARHDEPPVFTTGALRLALPPPWRGLALGPAVLGVRPDALQPGDGPGAWRCRVAVVEHLGDRADLFLEPEGGDGLPHLVARVPAAAAPREGEVVPFRPDPERLHLFDAASGRALAPA